ncbi:MAG: DUF418 domain-containing protein [Burkholderiaceae bacterium]|nr:DUF418 domain-containing protein [Burkholderiaceae bacterium]
MLDAIRGVALLGVLLVHTNEFAARTGTLVSGVLLWPWLDRWVDYFVLVLLSGKAQTLFTVMFGISFAIQMERLHAHYGSDAQRIYARRLVGLLAIAAANLILLPIGDILHEYALAGFFLLLTWRWSATAMIAAGLLLSIAARPSARALLFPIVPVHLDSAAAGAAPAVANAGLDSVNQTGSYVEIITHHLGTVWFVDNLAWGLLGLLPYVFGRFLLGTALVRTGVVTSPDRHRALLRWLAWLGIPLGIGLPVAAWTARSAEPTLDLSIAQLLQVATTYAVHAGTVVLGVAYLAAMLLAWSHRPLRSALAVFAPVGRMAVTNYLALATFNSFVFFGFGLQLLGRIGSAACFGIALVFFAVQIAFSTWWLRRFRFGPVEWLWRAWTYRRWPAWRSAG